MPRTEAQKKATLKWIENNKEFYIQSQRNLALNYYYAHKQEILEKKKLYYQQKKAKKLEEQNQQNEQN